MLEDENKGHDTLRALHTSFLESGADLIQSCTSVHLIIRLPRSSTYTTRGSLGLISACHAFDRYQCSFEGFAKQGHSESQAIALMHKAVSLADEAIASRCSHAKGKNKAEEAQSEERPQVVLALSCYGAILSPGQEYSGKYPPPFGHPSHSTTPASTTRSTTLANADPSATADVKSQDWRTRAEADLEQWHFNRLLVFASDASTWSKVGYVAFETLPVLYEARAIRRAMTRLKLYLQERSSLSQIRIHWPKWWISFVFPDGHLPKSKSLEEGDVSPSSIAKSVFTPAKMTCGESREQVDVEIPTGLGINCTKMRYLPKLVQEMTAAVCNIPRQSEQERSLVLYPDGGLVYDPVTKTWHQDSGGSIEKSSRPAEEPVNPAKEWASQLVDIANSAMHNDGGTGKAWDQIVLGGCCKASPAYIAELSQLSRV